MHTDTNIQPIRPVAPAKINRRQVAKARTRAAVLESAKQAFESVGFEAATIRGIAAGAKLSTGSVFSNFTDKVELYVAAFGHAPITPEQGAGLAAALRRAEAFVSGFEDDDSQEGVDQLLHEMRAALTSLKSSDVNADQVPPYQDAA